MKKTYRNNGAVGALLDEYERSINELTEVISSLSETELTTIIDKETQDEDCKSIQSILSHVVESGYAYAIEILKSLGKNATYRRKEIYNSSDEYTTALKTMFAYNEKLIDDYPNIKLAEFDPNKKFEVRWGQRYDVEQLFEHAIVHVLRHRRQIERFKLKMEAESAG